MGSEMNRLAIKFGYWSSFLIALAFILYTVGLAAILLAFRIPHWTNLSGFASAIDGTWFLLYSVCQFFAFVTAPLFMFLVNSIHDYAKFRTDKKILTRNAICCAVIFAMLSSINYFVQFTAVRQSILTGNLEGLDQFVQLNPVSAIAAINILGWTVFLGMSSLFLVPVFSGTGLEKVIKYSFLLNGTFCILGAIGYVFKIMALSFLFFYGMGAAVIVVSIVLSIWFRRMEKSVSFDSSP